MHETIKNLIPESTFLGIFALTEPESYGDFIEIMSEKIREITDDETILEGLEHEKPTWKDGGGNIHSRFYLDFIRRDESGLIGATVVRLVKRQSFRCVVWSNFEPKSDVELFSEGREMFRNGDYFGYLSISKHLRKSSYSSSKVYMLMNSIANKRAK